MFCLYFLAVKYLLHAHYYVHSSLPFLVSSCNSYPRHVQFELAVVHWRLIREVKCKYSVVYAILECSVLYAMPNIASYMLSLSFTFIGSQERVVSRL